MRSFYGIALLALPLISNVACEAPAASPAVNPSDKPIYANANEAFQDLLNALPEESLHAALNSLAGFKDGVFESDRHGVEHVHNDNPPLATKLIVAAVQDLKKRQLPSASTNGTASASSSSSSSSSSTPTQTSGRSSSQGPSPSSGTPAPSSTPVAASSSVPPPVVIPVKVTTTDSNGKPTVLSTSFLSKVTAFVPVDVTRTDAQGATIVTKESKPAVIFTETDSAGSTFVTASAVNFAPTKGQVLTETDIAGSTFLTTYTPPPGRVSSIVLITTMGPDGRSGVITSYTYVEPAAATSNSPQPTGTRPPPSLQTNAARANKAREMAVVGGVIGGAFMLFV